MNFYADEWREFIANCDFTDEESKVVALLRRGWYSVDIAEELGMGKRTVDRHRSRIIKKIKRYILKQEKE